MIKVSVLMPVYKTNEEYLREAIESILSQTFTDFEFLILDDCPEDDREKVVKSYHDDRIKYVKNSTNLGISQSRNKLIEMSVGEYLAVFDHDDVSMPERLEKEVKILDNHPEIGVVSCQILRLVKNSVSRHPEHNLEIKQGLMQGCIVAHTGAMIRKSVLEKNNIRYEEKFSPAEDYLLFLRLIKHAMFYNIQEVLVKYRDFAGNTSNLQKSKMMNADALCKCFALKEYPYLYQQYNLLHGRKRVWIKVIGIPLLKIKARANTMTGYLFGILPLIKIRI